MKILQVLKIQWYLFFPSEILSDLSTYPLKKQGYLVITGRSNTKSSTSNTINKCFRTVLLFLCLCIDE